MVDKTQAVRWIDILFVGPVMISAGRKLKAYEPGSTLGGSLVLMGLSTIVYNGLNLFDVFKQTDDAPSQ